jgi:hypothetical protein
LIPGEGKLYIYLVVALTTLILPVLLMPVLLRAGIISGYDMKIRDERRIPLLIMAGLYLAGAFILQKADAPMMLSLFLNGSSMVVLAVAIVNWKWKISNHMAGIGGVTGMVLAVSLRWMLNLQVVVGILFLIAGVIGFARLSEDDHTPGQIYAGYLMGLIMNFLLIWLI